ncbi:hypothetical protein VB620_03720 [Nodularia harveyana UHCC-0300]|uniref:Uncharacterized protein n=1 Tax=Nodularia harveyana UHCC-0300 TaxID=2974287 RepID=A0ABU5UAA6_9CYAN|nr:hypothetical protein [Nodularia harveyana UHCC-0300]
MYLSGNLHILDDVRSLIFVWDRTYLFLDDFLKIFSGDRLMFKIAIFYCIFITLNYMYSQQLYN